MSSTENQSAEIDRLLWGAKAIGVEIGRNERQAYHLLEKGLIPGEKVGKIWVSTPRRLRSRIVGNGA